MRKRSVHPALMVGLLAIAVGMAAVVYEAEQRVHRSRNATIETRSPNSPTAESGQVASVVYIWLDDQVERVATYPFHYSGKVTAQQYADALAARPEMEFTCSGEDRFHYRKPKVTVNGDSLEVNYTDVLEISSLSSCEMQAFFTSFNSWFFVPGVHRVWWLAEGKRVESFAEMGEFVQPLRMDDIALFYCYPRTGEIVRDGYGNSSRNMSFNNMTASLNNRIALKYPRDAEPLLPEGMIIRPSLSTNGVLTIDLPSSFPMYQPVRIAGLVLTYTQLPQVRVVRFTFAGKTLNTLFMRTTLDQPIHVYDLIVPYMQRG